MPLNPFDRFRLTNRTALVTGARREIGRAIALALAGPRLAIRPCRHRRGGCRRRGPWCPGDRAGWRRWPCLRPGLLRVDDAGHQLTGDLCRRVVSRRYPGPERLDRIPQKAGVRPLRAKGSTIRIRGQPAQSAGTAAGSGSGHGRPGWGQVVIGSVRRIQAASADDGCTGDPRLPSWTGRGTWPASSAAGESR